MQETPEWEGWVEKAFDAFDIDGSGRICVDDLSAMLCSDGVCAMPDVVAAALRCAPAACPRWPAAAIPPRSHGCPFPGAREHAWEAGVGSGTAVVAWHVFRAHGSGACAA